MEMPTSREMYLRSFMPIVIPQAITAARLITVLALLTPEKYS